ncbi:hypothetical protein SK128_000973 [Halocaridina rubra]|uniref:Uncharacterized protein n=1 Tax=Halocaridina rubra TaxID=373956 RepID=A0AAN8XCB2_HALRR
MAHPNPIYKEDDPRPSTHPHRDTYPIQRRDPTINPSTGPTTSFASTRICNGSFSFGVRKRGSVHQTHNIVLCCSLKNMFFISS